MSARAKRKSVRRIAIHRTRFRRTYMASDTSAKVDAALREHREVDGCRVRGVQRDECVHDRFRARRTAVEIVLAHQPAPTFLHGDGAHAPPSRCRATVLRPEITDHYRSDNASEPRLVGAVRPASLPESAKTSLAQKLTAQARTAWPWDGTGSPTRLIG
jgi:hypothetical protein